MAHASHSPCGRFNDMKIKVSEAETRAIAKTIERINRRRGLEGVSPGISSAGELFRPLNTYTNRILRITSSTICIDTKAILDEPRVNSWTKKVQEKIPNPIPAARQILSGRLESGFR